MTDYRVIVPQQALSIVRFRQENRPGLAEINRALVDFEPKAVFAWHLSVMLRLESVGADGLPDETERAVADSFNDELRQQVAPAGSRQPNGLFLARIDWNSTRELIYRIYDPEPVARYLREIITDKSHVRPFDFRIDPDRDWHKAEWHLGHFGGD